MVTIPKSEYENDELETEEMLAFGYEQFWTLSKVPKNLRIGDRVYFVKYQQIESSMRVIQIEIDTTKRCETTERVWNGRCQITLNDLRDETNLNLKTKGFQGFRYKWWEKATE